MTPSRDGRRRARSIADCASPPRYQRLRRIMSRPKRNRRRYARSPRWRGTQQERQRVVRIARVARRDPPRATLYSARAFEQHRNRNRRPFRHPFGDSLIGFLAVCLEARRYSVVGSEETNRVECTKCHGRQFIGSEWQWARVTMRNNSHAENSPAEKNSVPATMIFRSARPQTPCPLWNLSRGSLLMATVPPGGSRERSDLSYRPDRSDHVHFVIPRPSLRNTDHDA